MCEFSTPDLDLTAELELYKRVGAVAISPVEHKLCAVGAVKAKELIDRCGLRVSHGMPAMVSVLPHAVFSPAPIEVEARLHSLHEALDLFGQVGARSMNCAAGTIDARAPAESRRTLVEGLRDLSKHAGSLGMRLGFEVVRSPSITTIPEALELLAEVGSADAGIVVDPWHLWDTPGYPDVVRSIPAPPVSVQLSDAGATPRSLQDRKLPGEGVARLPALLRLLREMGYEGSYDLEVLSDDGRFGNAFLDSLWKLPTEEFLVRAKRGFDAAWAASF